MKTPIERKIEKAIDRFGEYWFDEKRDWKTIELPLKDFIYLLVAEAKEEGRREEGERIVKILMDNITIRDLATKKELDKVYNKIR